MSWPARGYVSGMKILVAVDETPASVHALEVARSLFGDGAEYLAVNVSSAPTAATGATAWGDVWMPSYAPAGGFMPPMTSTATDAGAAPLQSAQAAAEDVAARVAQEAGVPAEPIGEVGDPAQAILDASIAQRVDVIVVGSHDRGWFSRLWHRATAEEVARASSLPVLVVG
jgi:nucleotide-binding universal stress UspA family protein